MFSVSDSIEWINKTRGCVDAEGRLAALGLAPCRGQIGKTRGRSRDPDGEAAAAGARTQHHGHQRRAHGRVEAAQP